MKIEVFFKTKNEAAAGERFVEDINCCDVEGKITRKEKKFIVQLCGDEECVIAMLRLIWEISFLYEGYFYSPDRYWVDGSLKNVNDLYFLYNEPIN